MAKRKKSIYEIRAQRNRIEQMANGDIWGDATEEQKSRARARLRKAGNVAAGYEANIKKTSAYRKQKAELDRASAGGLGGVSRRLGETGSLQRAIAPVNGEEMRRLEDEMIFTRHSRNAYMGIRG